MIPLKRTNIVAHYLECTEIAQHGRHACHNTVLDFNLAGGRVQDIEVATVDLQIARHKETLGLPTAVAPKRLASSVARSQRVVALIADEAQHTLGRHAMRAHVEVVDFRGADGAISTFHCFWAQKGHLLNQQRPRMGLQLMKRERQTCWPRLSLKQSKPFVGKDVVVMQDSRFQVCTLDCWQTRWDTTLLLLVLVGLHACS